MTRSACHSCICNVAQSCRGEPAHSGKQPGLLFDAAFNMTTHTRWRMSAVNWLTAIRGDLLDLCEGPDAVLAQLGQPGFQTARYGESGLFIQAGPSPQPGNLKTSLMLPHYGDLAGANVRSLCPHVQFRTTLPDFPDFIASKPSRYASASIR